MTTMASQITSLTVVYSPFIQTQIKRNIQAPRHWPLCGEFTGTGEFPAQRASNAEMFPFDDVIMNMWLDAVYMNIFDTILWEQRLKSHSKIPIYRLH